MGDHIFVFGSNLAGRHGKGAAKFAVDNYGAKRGVGEGRQGQSYAIPTKDGKLAILPLARIAASVRDFLRYAALYEDETFEVTPIGCGLAGYEPEQIAPMFAHAPKNVILPEEFK